MFLLLALRCVLFKKELAARREILRQVSLFRMLTEAEIDAVAAHATTQSHARGSAILRQGDPASAMLIVLQGRVRVGVSVSDGRELNLRVMGPGEVIGEISLLDGQDRSTDVYALEACALLKVERDHFLTLLRSSSDLCLRLMTVLCDKIRRTTVSFEEALLLDLSARLARQLQRMAQEHGVTTPDGLKIGVRLSQSELATLVGASREKVSRQIKLWKDKGIIRNKDGYILLCDLEFFCCDPAVRLGA